MPVTLSAKDQLPSVGYPSDQSGVGITLEALHVNLGSGENFRHLEHGSESSLGPQIWTALRSNKLDSAILQMLTKKDGPVPNMQTADRKKFNSIVSEYMENTTKTGLEAMATAFKTQSKLMVR